MLAGDILTAFDRMRPRDVAEAMERRGTNARVTLAFVRESLCQQAEVYFQNMLISMIQISACEKTGATDSTVK